MPRHPDMAQLEGIYRQIKEHPGERPSLIARLLGLHRSEVTRALPSMEGKGFLICEDDHGRLWPFSDEE